MKCVEAEALLEAFHDGELDGRRMRDTAVHLAACTACVAQLGEYERLQMLVTDSVEAELAGFHEGRVWAGVEEAIASIPVRQNAWRGFRLAAASAKVRGVLVGGRPAENEENDPWLAPVSRGRMVSRPVFFGGGLALAASLLLAFLLLGEEEAVLAPGAAPSQLATVGAPATFAPVARRLQAPGVVAAAFPAARDSVQQVQIHSLKDFGGEMAMWAEPAGDTAVIWLGDAAPLARR
jgi:anti-sigma factor RsiW